MQKQSFGKLLFSFKGRITKIEFWTKAFPILTPCIILLFVFVYMELKSKGQPGLISILFGLICLWLTLAVAIKRLHDRDRSGVVFWYLLVPVVNIFIAIWIIIEIAIYDGTEGNNYFGDDPYEIKCKFCDKRLRSSLMKKLDKSSYRFQTIDWKFNKPFPDKSEGIYFCQDCYNAAKKREENFLSMINEDAIWNKFSVWLKNNEGKEVSVSYDTTEGKRFSKRIKWIVSKPIFEVEFFNGNSAGRILLDIRDSSSLIEFQYNPDKYRTYREIKNEAENLIYRTGWKNYIDDRGEISALLGVNKLSDVEIWHTYKFLL